MCVPVDRVKDGSMRLELASLRGGGATDLWLSTEGWSSPVGDGRARTQCNCIYRSSWPRASSQKLPLLVRRRVLDAALVCPAVVGAGAIEEDSWRENVAPVDASPTERNFLGQVRRHMCDGSERKVGRLGN